MIEQLFTTPEGWIVLLGLVVVGVWVAGAIAELRPGAPQLRPARQQATPQRPAAPARLLDHVPAQGRHRRESR